jgi:hypothetical protein
MLSNGQKKILSDNLSECKNVQEMFNLLSNTFDLKGCSPGMISKPVFISGILKGIDLVDPKLK